MEITCRTCKQTKPALEFYFDKRKAGHHYKECKKCAGQRSIQNLHKRMENPEFKAQYAAKQSEAYYRLYQGKRTERHRQNEVWRKYHLSNEQYQEMLDAQNNECACCHDPFTRTPHVDHDHSTDKVRGLLCGPCNHGIGLLGDTLEGLLKAVAYLQS